MRAYSAIPADLPMGSADMRIGAVPDARGGATRLGVIRDIWRPRVLLPAKFLIGAD